MMINMNIMIMMIMIMNLAEIVGFITTCFVFEL